MTGHDNVWLALVATQVPILRLLMITQHSSGWRLLVMAMRNDASVPYDVDDGVHRLIAFLAGRRAGLLTQWLSGDRRTCIRFYTARDEVRHGYFVKQLKFAPAGFELRTFAFPLMRPARPPQDGGRCPQELSNSLKSD